MDDNLLMEYLNEDTNEIVINFDNMPDEKLTNFYDVLKSGCSIEMHIVDNQCTSIEIVEVTEEERIYFKLLQLQETLTPEDFEYLIMSIEKIIDKIE